MRTTVRLALVMLVLAASLAACGGGDAPDELGTDGGAPSAEPPPAGGVQRGFEAELAPLNDSGVEGTVSVSQLGGTLRVQTMATGAAPGENHPQRLHVLPDGAPGACPDEEADTNDDDVVTQEESVGTYGPVAIELTPVPAADDDGNLLFQGTFDAGPELESVEGGAIVVHGVEADGEYQENVPAACGVLEVAG